MRNLAAIAALLFLAACSGMTVTTTDPATGATTTTIDVSKGQLQVALAADFEAAARYAERGCSPAQTAKVDPNKCFPDRAAVLRANAGLLHAIERQASGCLNAIRASLGPDDTADAPADAGPITRLEMFNEKVGSIKLLTPTALILCKDIPVAAVPSMPKP